MKAVKKYSDNGVYFKMVEDTIPEIEKDTEVKILFWTFGWNCYLGIYFSFIITNKQF